MTPLYDAMWRRRGTMETEIGPFHTQKWHVTMEIEVKMRNTGTDKEINTQWKYNLVYLFSNIQRPGFFHTKHTFDYSIHGMDRSPVGDILWWPINKSSKSSNSRFNHPKLRAGLRIMCVEACINLLHGLSIKDNNFSKFKEQPLYFGSE